MVGLGGGEREREREGGGDNNVKKVFEVSKHETRMLVMVVCFPTVLLLFIVTRSSSIARRVAADILIQ